MRKCVFGFAGGDARVVGAVPPPPLKIEDPPRTPQDPMDPPWTPQDPVGLRPRTSGMALLESLLVPPSVARSRPRSLPSLCPPLRHEGP